MIMTQRGSGAPWLQRSWDSRAACNFIGGGSGAGLLVAATAAKFAGWPYFPAGMLAIALICFGLSMVWLEIGRPFRAVNVFFHPQTSWISREAILALPLLGFAGAAVIIDQNVVTLPAQISLPATPFALTSAVLALAFLCSQARILRASQGVPAWREPSLQTVIVVTGIVEGLGLLLVLGLFIVMPPAWIIPAAIVALVVRAAAWEHYRHRVTLTAPEPAVAALNRASVVNSSFGSFGCGCAPDRVAYVAHISRAGSRSRPVSLCNWSLVEVCRCHPCGFYARILYSPCTGARTCKYRVARHI